MRHIEHNQTEIVFRKPGKRQHVFHVNDATGKKIEQFLMEHNADPIPAEEVLPDIKDPKKRIAACLRGARYREELTQKQLATKIKILPHHISEMESGKRAISKEMAKKLATALGCNYRVFL